MTVDKLGNRMIAISAFLAPAVAAIGVRFISHAPGEASAAAPGAAGAPVVAAQMTPDPTLAPEQLKVVETAKIPVEKELPTPFLAAVDPESRVGAVVEAATNETVDTKVARGPMVLTSIFSGRRTVAIINGKVRRLDDEVEKGWRVSAIDADAGTVTVENGLREQVLLKIHRLPARAEHK